jgi:hypothetical protein
MSEIIRSLAVLELDEKGNKKYGTPIPLSAHVENIEIETALKAELATRGITLSQDNLDALIRAIAIALQNKAAIKHSSSATNYGVGSTTEYGHLRITDDYNDAGTDASHTAVSAKAIQELLSGIGNFLNLFQVIDEDTLFSGCISAYRPAGMGEDKLKLVDSYFSIEENSTGNYTLTIK